MRKDFKKNVVSVLSVLSIGCAACGAYVLSAEVNDTLATAAIEQTQTVELKGDFVMKSGASVRKEDPKGIRFSTYVKESQSSPGRWVATKRSGIPHRWPSSTDFGNMYPSRKSHRTSRW